LLTLSTLAPSLASIALRISASSAAAEPTTAPATTTGNNFFNIRFS